MTAAEEPDDPDVWDSEAVDEPPEVDIPPRKSRRPWWPRRAPDAAEDEPGAEVVQLHKTPAVSPPPPAVEPAPAAPSAARQVLARLTDRPLPTRRQVAVNTGWWGMRLAKLAPRLPWLLLCELAPILRGTGRLAVGWASWVNATVDRADAAHAEGNLRAKQALAASKKARANGIITLILAAAWSAGWLWLWLAHFTWAVVGTVAVLGVLDLIGRSGRPPGEAPVILPPGPIGEGMSLSSLRTEIAESFQGQGVDATVALPIPVMHGWTVAYHARQAVEDEQLRQLERDLNVRRAGITQIREKGAAARATLHVMIRDPLADTVDSPEYDALSIYQPSPLGVTASGAQWTERFLRAHFVVAGASQSGKSSGLWQIVDVLRRCPEVELDAIDLTDGPAFSACRRAFRRRATTKEDARRVLTEAVALIKARAAELSRLAEAEDTPDDYDEKWAPTFEHPQRVVVIDEAAQVTEDPDLQPLTEHILRYGAKTAVILGQAWQGTTVADSGTSVARAMVMIRILFACSRSDVLNLFGKDARDAGYRPDLLEPANGSDLRDAGKCFVRSGSSTTPEAHRAYRLEQHEVRRRDRALGTREQAQEAVDAVEVPLLLAAVEAAFGAAGNPDRMATADLLGWLRDAGHEVDADRLAAELRPLGLRPAEKRWVPSPGANPVRGYLLQDVSASIRRMA